MVAVRRNYNIPARLENGLDESCGMANYDWDGNGYCCRQCRYRLCRDFSDNFTLDREIKDVRPQSFFETMGKNQNRKERRKKMKKVGKILLLIVILAVYLNFGWMMGAYYSDHATIKTHPEEVTTFGKFMIGAGSIFIGGDPTKTQWCILSSFLWPVGLALSLVSWIVYGCYYASWFIFAGGGAKLLGLV